MIDKKDDVAQSQQYPVLRLYLTIVGLWPYHSLRDRCICFVSLFVFCFSIAIPQTLYLLIGPVTLNDIFECVPSLLISLLFSFKMLVIISNSEKVKTCLNTIQKDWLSVNTNVERVILQQHTKYGQYLMIFYAVFMHLTGCLFVLKPIMLTLMADDSFNVTKSSIPYASRLPFHVEYGMKINQYVYPIAVHCYTSVFAHSFVTVAVDGLYCTLIQHACGMFSIIGNTLENIGRNDENNFNAKSVKIKDDNYAKVLHCLRTHILVIEFTEHIESLYTKIFLLNLNFNAIGGSLVGIEVLTNLDKSANDVSGPLTIYIAQLIHLFLLFWQAQFLLDYSVVPYESICRAHWYYTSRKCQKLFLLIMNRTMSPCKLTAGKIMILSIESFATVVKTSISYLTVFRSFQ